MSDLVKRAFQLMGIEEPEPVVQATPAESTRTDAGHGYMKQRKYP